MCVQQCCFVVFVILLCHFPEACQAIKKRWLIPAVIEHVMSVMYSYYIHYRFLYPMPIPIMFRWCEIICIIKFDVYITLAVIWYMKYTNIRT